MRRTDTPTLIAAMRVLARDVESEDGVANAAIAEAAERLEEMRGLLVDMHPYLVHADREKDCHGCALDARWKLAVQPNAGYPTK